MQRRRLLVTAVLAALFAGAAPAAHAQATSKEPRLVKFTLSWLPQSVDAPLYVAMEKGYFEKAGVKVQVDRGFGSADAVTKIGTGSYPIGEGDIYSMIEYNSKVPADQQLVAVAVKYNRSPLAIVSLKEKGIDTPAKLNGRSIGDVAGSATKRLFPVFAKRAGIDDASTKWTNVEARLREQLLVRGEFEAAGVFTLSALPPLRKMGYDESKLNVLYYADAGLDLYGNGVITSKRFARENPDIVSAIVRGYVMGLRDTLAAPDAAFEMVAKQMKGDVGWDADLERYRLKLVIDRLYIDAKDRKTVGVGGLDPKRFEVGVRQVAEGFGLTTIPAVSDVFDGRFLPPLAERN